MKIWNSPSGGIKLKRYPFAGENSHQAWDAADEWMVSHFPEHHEPIMITGEAFGVLGTFWGNTDITATGDSFMSFEALKENRKLNSEKSSGALTTVTTTDPEPASHTCFKKIFVRLPKSLELLEIFIRMIIPYSDADTEVWIGGMEKRWSRGTSTITEKYLLTTEVFPFERHARWIRHKPNPEAASMNKMKNTEENLNKIWSIGRYSVSICPSPAVFSNASIDPGTSAFLEAFPEKAVKESEAIIDLGCGSGLLGLCAATINTEAKITFTDESYLAAKSAETNFKYNHLCQEAYFLVTNGARGIDDSSQDLVLCNPPFHYQNIQTREPADFLFSEAFRVLKPDGRIQIVGNSHLGYHKLLRKYFPETMEIYSNSKFTVLLGRKPY